MGTGQILSVLGAIMILSMVSLAINTMIVGKTTTMLEAEASLTAISLAQTMIDEVQRKSFDKATVSTLVYDPTNFTASSSLGPDGSELSNVPLPDSASPYNSDKYYNDVDDYNGYSRKASTPLMGTFTLMDSVYYVSESNPDSVSTTQTFFKKIVVRVSHPNMSYPLVISDVAVYRRYF